MTIFIKCGISGSKEKKKKQNRFKVSFCSYFLMQLGWVERILPESSMMMFGLSLNTLVLLGMLIYLPFASFRARWIYAVQGFLLFLFSFR